MLAMMLVRLRSSAVPFGWAQLVRAQLEAPLAWPGLRFARVLGSGRGGGFGLVPSLHRQGWIGFFDDEANAQSFVEASPLARAYHQRAEELLVATARATSCRGSWSGATLAVTAQARPGERCAALTRAAIRPLAAARFWRHAPATGRGIAEAEGCQLAAGLGEAPLLRQATFSLWDDSAAMDAYARRGAHQSAIAGAWREGWFAESMFVRLQPLRVEGRWHGRTFS